MLVLHTTNALTYIRATKHPVNVALRDLGARPARAIQESTQGLHPSTGDNRQVHQVYRAKPIVRVRSEDTVEFFLDIIYRFGVPNSIITDNDTLFTRKKFL
jgi:hypothetical protein